MNNETYIEDLKMIREMMNRSSRFISLSGLSGVFAGSFALIGAYLAYLTVYANQDYLQYRKAVLTTETITTLLLIAVVTLLLSITMGIFLSKRKARKDKEKVWNLQAKRMLINLFIPLITGGILSLIFLFKGYIGIVAPLTLIFYGLALVNASKYTLTEIRSLASLKLSWDFWPFNLSDTVLFSGLWASECYTSFMALSCTLNTGNERNFKRS